MANLKPCFTDGYSGHDTLEYAILSTLNKAAAGGHRSEIKLEKFALSLGCKIERLRSSLRKLSDGGNINCPTVIDWDQIGSIQLGQPIVTCEAVQFSLDDFDEPSVGSSLDALSPTNDVDLEFDGRFCRFAIRYEDDGQVTLTISDGKSHKAKNRDEVVNQTFATKDEAISYARDYVGT